MGHNKRVPAVSYSPEYSAAIHALAGAGTHLASAVRFGLPADVVLERAADVFAADRRVGEVVSEQLADVIREVRRPATVHPVDEDLEPKGTDQ